ncbi:hypothetical protein CAL7102_07274 [Dulcicalothrix desertica PCC 7102]|nr:hypothetical protein CAL7102_07274 [Dulcicalothrix desertica PCC 7102]
MKIFRFGALLTFSVCLIIIFWLKPWHFVMSNAQVDSTQKRDLPTRTLTTSGNTNVLLPDWSQISFSRMPAITESGSINVNGIDRKWRQGDTPDKYLTLGDIDEALRPDLLSLNTIAQTLNYPDLDTFSLDSFPKTGQQTLQELVDAVPSLESKSAAQVPPIAKLLQTKSPQTNLNSPLREILAPDSALEKLKLNQIDLSPYTVADIPGIETVQLSNFTGWQNSLIKDVPLLNSLSLASFPIKLTESGNTVARIDLIWGQAEKRRQRTVSGSDVAGFAVPCSGQSCPYIELDDLENSGRNIRGEFEGRSWISGKYQKVDGGWGCLKSVNGGKEPTGRLPFGSAFKVVVMEPDEKTDTVDTALFFRFKNICGATPYFIGPVPFMTYRVNAPIFIGASDSIAPTSIQTQNSNIKTRTGATNSPNSEVVQSPAQKNCQPTETIQGVNVAALSKSINDVESRNGDYNAVGTYTCVDGEADCGIALGKYQAKSYDPDVQQQVTQVEGGKEFLAKLSGGYKPDSSELFQFFPPAAQDAVFETRIRDKVNSTSKEIDPTTKNSFSSERLVERVAQKYFGGDSSQVDSNAKDIFGRVSVKNYASDVLQRYKDIASGC